ncbi:MAG: TonB-dependent receptor [Acidobacteriota bacterium]
MKLAHSTLASAERRRPATRGLHRAALLLTLLLALTASAASSQDRQVEGTVKDTDGRALESVVVEGLRAGQLIGSTETDGSGAYSLGVSAGAVTLRYRLDGFETQQIALDSSADSQDVVLEIGTINDSVVVTASRTERSEGSVTESITVFDEEDIESLGAVDLGEIVRAVPGLQVEMTGREGSLGSLFARGGESDYNLVYIDGVRVNISGGRFDINRVTSSEIEKVEVLRGAQSALYGSDAIGSVVNIFTKRGNASLPPSFIGNAEAGSFDSIRGSARYVSGLGTKGDISIGGTHRETEGAFQSILPENDSYEQTTANITGGAILGDSASLRGSIRHSEAEGRSVGQIAYGVRDSGGVYDSTDSSANVTFTQQVTSNFDHTVSASYFENDNVFADTIADPSINVFAILEGEIGAIFPDSPRLVRFLDEAEFNGLLANPGGLGPRQFLASTPFGVSDFPFGPNESDFERSAFRYQGNVAWGDDELLSFGYEYEEESEPINGFDRDNNSVFVQQQFNFEDRWFLSLGARLDDNSFFGTEVNPKLSGGGFIVPYNSGSLSSLKFQVNYSEGIKAPVFSELFGSAFSDGNPDLLPEKARTADVGIEATFSDRRFLVGVTYFDNEYEDQVAFRSSGGFGTDGVPDFFNIAGSEADGFEFHLRLQRPIGGFTASLNWAIVDTVVTETASSSVQFQPGQPLLRRPENSGTARLNYTKGPWTFNANVQHVGERHDSAFLFLSTPDFQSTDITVNPEYTLVGLNAEYRFSEAFAIYARGENLTDEDYEFAIGFPGAPANYYAGVRFDIGGGR